MCHIGKVGSSKKFSQFTGQVVSKDNGKSRHVRITYDSEARIFLAIGCHNPLVGAIEEQGGIVRYGEDGEPVSVEFLNASAR